jgi:hypothetical protein
MRIAFTIGVALHGLIHLLGPAKAFGWAEVTRLRQPISAGRGATWLMAAALLLATAAVFGAGWRWWWLVALPAIALSQFLIVATWGDARFGTVANGLILIPVLVSALDLRSTSFRSRFDHDSRTALASPLGDIPRVTEADLSSLPALMQAYLRRVGAVGRPHVRNMRVVFDAQMRFSAHSKWMESSAVQYEFFAPAARLFHMNASLYGLPFDILHRYVGDGATFQVRIAGLVPVVDVRGATLTRAETVTLLNDVVVMAPAAVLDLPLTWEATGPRTVRTTFSNAGHTVAAVLTFSDEGDLVGFLSGDRTQEDAKGSRTFPWSTPISEYAEVDGIRVGTHGSANWIEPSGEWTYGKFVIRELAYNVAE